MRAIRGSPSGADRTRYSMNVGICRLTHDRGLVAPLLLAALALTASVSAPLAAQSIARATPQAAALPVGPPLHPAVFPLKQLHAGMTATAWTVFEGTRPEPMQVEILGVLHNARGPGEDMILARLHGAKPEYTGVVAGMSGSPVYIGNKLLGALSYRIGQFTKEPIAGITPIAQMLDVSRFSGQQNGGTPGRVPDLAAADHALAAGSLDPAGAATTFEPMETPLVESGLAPESIRFWQQQMAGTSLATIAAGGSSSGADAGSLAASGASRPAQPPPSLLPGSSVSMQLVRGDIEVAATCTVTWIDPKQLLACGHPVLGAGPVSLPMTTAEVVATVASPLNAFKIVNTGATIGAFDEDRASAIHGLFGARASMIPVRVAVDAPSGKRVVNAEILDLPSLTTVAMQTVLLDALIQTNTGSEALSYHLTGSIELAGEPAMPLDAWASAGTAQPAALQAALLAGQQFAALYANKTRQGVIRRVDLHVQAVPHSVLVTLTQARILSGDTAHAGDTVAIEATLQPWQQPERNLRIGFRLPARLAAGNLRLLVSGGVTLDRTLHPFQLNAAPPDLAALRAEVSTQHDPDRIYVSLLAPDAEGEVEGQTLASLPLSVANAFEPLRNAQQVNLNGESAQPLADLPAGGLLNGFQLLSLHIEPGGGLN